ncbi:response regulator [Caballeronia calidae]
MATVLLLDDSESNLPSLQVALEHAGHSVLAAANGREGLELLASHCPHVIVTDWQMPLMDGVEFCSLLRQRIIFRSVPIILLSGRPEPEHPNPPWTQYFRKPVSLARLTHAVESLANPRLFRAHADVGISPLMSRWVAVNAACWP